jgi:hypothetical protein
VRVLKIFGNLAVLPLPQIQPFLAELTLEHIGDVFSDYGEEFEAMVGPNRSDEKVLGFRVWADAEV